MMREKKSYRVFTRTWWRENPDWPNGLEPHAGPKHTIGYAADEREARQMCAEWAHKNRPGRLSHKAEYERMGVEE